ETLSLALASGQGGGTFDAAFRFARAVFSRASATCPLYAAGGSFDARSADAAAWLAASRDSEGRILTKFKELGLHTVRLAPGGTGGDAWGALLEELAKAERAGARIDWEAFHAGDSAQLIRMPTYPFERKCYW